MLTVTDFDNLKWAFNQNNKFYSELIETYSGNEDYLKLLDDLIIRLRSQNCKNIQEKMRCIGCFKKFFSTLSELRFALDLGINSEVTLLPDEYNGGGAPDFTYSVGKTRFIVEVTRISDEETSGAIFDFLRPLLKNTGYCVDSYLKEELAHPKFYGVERERNEEYVKSSLKEFAEKFMERNGQRAFRVNTEHINFEVEKTKSGKGYPGLVSGGAFWVDSEYIMEYAQKRIIEKAVKAEKYLSSFPDARLLIAIDCEERVANSRYIEETLYGQRPQIVAANDRQRVRREQDWGKIIQNKEQIIPGWERIEKATELGWEKFLVDKYMIPNGYIYLKESGLFFNIAETRKVSGILYKWPVNQLDFFPNPFSDREFNLMGNLEIR